MLAIVLGALLMCACSPTVTPTFDPDAGSMTATEVDRQAQSVDLSPAAAIDVEHAADARTDALVWLRRQGALGDRAATLLTDGFPDRTSAVPLLVEIATVDGVRSLVVVEAFGDKTGPLSRRRLWVFDLDTGEMLRSAAFR